MSLSVSSTEPKLSKLRGANRIDRHPVFVHCCPFSKIFSETAWIIKARFYLKHLGRGTNVFINNPGHMFKMATKMCINHDPVMTFTYFKAKSP